MLEKLGESLRKARDKIANALFLDKNVVESVVRELQRALIEADVNIILVKEISDKIKKPAFDERINEIEKKALNSIAEAIDYAVHSPEPEVF